MGNTSTRQERIARLIRNVPDFPQPGIQFKDITPLLGSPSGLSDALSEMLETAPHDIDAVAGIESRGFIFAAPMALMLHVGLVPIRKPGKLPGPVYEETFNLEYGTETLTIHQDALQPGQRVLLVDDLLASGGTLVAASKLIHRTGAEVVHTTVLLELAGLSGRETMAKAGLTSLTSVVAC